MYKWLAGAGIVIAFGFITRTTSVQPIQHTAYYSADSAELVQLLTTLAAKEKNPLLKRHFQTVATFTKDNGSGFAFTPSTENNLSETLQFFKGEGARWDTYLNNPRPLMMGFTSKTDGKKSYYWLIVPKGFDPKRTDFPLYLELHGSGGGTNNDPRIMLYQPLQLKPGGVTNQGYRREGFMLMPWGRGDKWYRDTAEQDIWECLADFDGMFKTDPKRQFLYGFSMGGSGTFNLAQKTVNRWAAIGLYSAALRSEPTREQASAFKNIPVWMCWGEKEDRLAANNRILKDYFLQAGVNLWWTEVKDVGHNYLGQYQDSLMNWFVAHPKQ